MMIDKQLLKGSLKTVALHMLAKRAMHGYELSQTLKKLSEGQFTITEGTLYPLLHSLKADGYVETIDEENEGGRKRKIYHLTDKGKKYLKDKKKEWTDYKNLMEGLLTSRQTC
jgi:PadR family transcriptional regulator PadR